MHTLATQTHEPQNAIAQDAVCKTSCMVFLYLHICWIAYVCPNAREVEWNESPFPSPSPLLPTLHHRIRFYRIDARTYGCWSSFIFTRFRNRRLQKAFRLSLRAIDSRNLIHSTIWIFSIRACASGFHSNGH